VRADADAKELSGVLVGALDNRCEGGTHHRQPKPQPITPDFVTLVAHVAVAFTALAC